MFHDIVYNPKADKGLNEKESADKFLKFVEENGISADVSEFVNQAILDTVTHVPTSPNELIHSCLDCDLSILASSKDQYDAYKEAIRFEYQHIEIEDYKKGRSKVLQVFVERPRLFYTDEIEKTY